MVEELSVAYNTGTAEGRRKKLPIEARVAFSFPRDVPKAAAAVRELVASGALAMPADRPLRVIDLGAGLGAMTWGLVRALGASGASGRVDALFVDEDDEVLRHAVEIGRAARALIGTAPIDLDISTRGESIASIAKLPSLTHGGGPADVVILGQVLSEIDPRSEPDARVESQVAIVLHVLEKMVAADGALVIVEPALRDRTRHLHAVRDRIVAQSAASGKSTPATVFAPCLHAASCPALAIETEWCHEDLPVDLPSWVVPLARASGLRWQGLTFSYLVLRKDGRVPVPRLPADDGARVRFRAVSDLLRTKGKAELFVCAEDGLRTRIRRLDRDVPSERGIPFADLRRGDIVTLSSAIADSSKLNDPVQGESPLTGRPIDERGRVRAETHAAIDVGAVRK